MVELFSLGLSLVTSVLPVVTGSLVVDSELVTVVETRSGRLGSASMLSDR